MGGYGCSEEDGSTRFLVFHLAGDGLRGEECAGCVDVEGAGPFCGSHIEGVCAADYTGETEEMVNGAESVVGRLYSVGELGGGRHVDLNREYLSVGKVFL